MHTKHVFLCHTPTTIQEQGKQSTCENPSGLSESFVQALRRVYVVKHVRQT